MKTTHPVTQIDNIPVRCSFTHIVPPGELNPHPGNPNEHPRKQLELFAKIVKYQGFRRPVTVSTRSGFVTRGHGQMEMAKIAGLSGVPVDYQEYEDEAQEIADLIADNELAKWATIDSAKMKDALIQIDTGEIDMELTGFDMSELEDLMTQAGPPPALTFSQDGEQREDPFSSDEDGPDGETKPSEGPAAPSGVKMVNLFLDLATFPEFEKIINHFQGLLGTQNPTDTCMQVLRHAYDGSISATLGTSEGTVG